MWRFISTRKRQSTVLVSVLVLMAWSCSPSPEAVESRAAVADSVQAADLKIVVLGDSIAAGLGLAESNAFPAIAEELLVQSGHSVRVVNAGVSGDTSAGGLRRIKWILQQEPDLVVVELGGNDALRGQPLESIESNLRGIVREVQASGARVLLLGMDVPTNYGPDYGEGFAALYQRIAADEELALVPGFMREVGIDPNLMQGDGLHPTDQGQRRLAEQILPALEEIVAEISAKITSPEADSDSSSLP
jgi:acyl-CoA thioesterase-1